MENMKTLEKGAQNAKIAGLREKAKEYRSVGLYNEAVLYETAVAEIEAESLGYEVVTEEKGRDLLCPKVVKRCVGTWTRKGAQYSFTVDDYRREGKMPWEYCTHGRFFPHTVTFQHELGKWGVATPGDTGWISMGVGEPRAPRPEVPFGVVSLLKEAKGKGLSDFKVWAPVPFGQEKLIDPWLVGSYGPLLLKVADWR
jgi:hypothetical protein